jgi:hypothetical protein
MNSFHNFGGVIFTIQILDMIWVEYEEYEE